MTRSRWFRWLAPLLVLAVAAALRFWALGRPGTLVFDELYYVRDAISQLAHGYPTVWPDDEPDMSGARATAFLADPSNAVHPPLGKWLIGLGILAFGPGNGWGWRSAVALAGVLTVAVTMRLGWRITRRLSIACTAGLLLAIDGVHLVLTRVGLLDGFLALAIAVGALCTWRDIEQTAARGATVLRARPGDRTARFVLPIIWRRPWLLAAAAAFGAAAAIKWSGLYPLAAFLVFITVRDLVVRLRAVRLERGAGSRSTMRALAGAALQAGVAAVLALPMAVLVYLTSWTGWIVTPGGWGRGFGASWPEALLKYHADMLAWHSTLSAEHPYAASPLTWPLALRPTGMYESHWGRSEGCPWSGCVATVTPIPNALVTWGGVVALIALVGVIVHRLRRGPDPVTTASAFVVVGYFSGWLPWVLTVSRSAVFQFYAVVLTPFSALALALALALLCRIAIRPALPDAVDATHAEPQSLEHQAPTGPIDMGPHPVTASDAQRALTAPETVLGIRIATGLFLVVAVAVSLLYFPLWSGAPIAEWFWRAHLWLPGWD